MNPPPQETAAWLLWLYRNLRECFGYRNWWPGETALEIMVGAILTQNTAWVNVERAIKNLKSQGLMNWDALRKIGEPDLAALIQPSGYYNQKAVKVKRLINWLEERCEGNLKKLESVDMAELRIELLALKGIGPETADSILLYALERPTFVVDAYTRRVLGRWGRMPPTASYEQLRYFFMDHLPLERELFNDFHAQFVELGKRWCQKKPKCGECGLMKYCPKLLE